MTLFLISFIAGFLTVLAPCILPLLPIILSGSIRGRSAWHPILTAISFSASIFICTLLLKATTLFVPIPSNFWSMISGGILFVVGGFMIFPHLWEKLTQILKSNKSQNLLEKAAKKEGFGGSVLLGSVIGPVFASCSPTYAIILATILPGDFFYGTLLLLVFCIGAMIPMLMIGFSGRKFLKKFAIFSNPTGTFKKTLGIVLCIVGISIALGWDKQLEIYLLDLGYTGPILLEQYLLGFTSM